MIWQHFSARIALAALLATAAGAARADIDEDLRNTDVAMANARDELDRIESVLNQRFDNLALVQKLYGRYAYLRDNRLLGNRGVEAESAAIVRDLNTWMSVWYATLPLVEDAAYVAKLENRNTILQSLRTQQDKWLSIQERARSVRGVASDARLSLDSAELSLTSVRDEYRDTLGTLNSQLTKLREAFGRTEAALDTRFEEAFSTLIGPVSTAIVARLKLALLTYPELRTAIEETENMLAAEELLRPLNAELGKLVDSVAAAAIDGRYFAAQRALAAVQANATAGDATVRAAAIDGRYKVEGLQQVEWQRTRASDIVRNKFGTLAASAAVKSYFKRQTKAFARDCRNDALRAQRNCSLLGTLVKVAPTQLDGLPVDQLAFIEDSVFRVQSGVTK